MISKEERREVASKLRLFADSYTPPQKCLDEIFEAIGFDPKKEENRTYFDYGIDLTIGFCRHLADLIDPEPERTCHMIDNGCELCCSVCDERFDYDNDPKYCSQCGSKVI